MYCRAFVGSLKYRSWPRYHYQYWRPSGYSINTDANHSRAACIVCIPLMHFTSDRPVRWSSFPYWRVIGNLYLSGSIWCSTKLENKIQHTCFKGSIPVVSVQTRFQCVLTFLFRIFDKLKINSVGKSSLGNRPFSY